MSNNHGILMDKPISELLQLLRNGGPQLRSDVIDVLEATLVQATPVTGRAHCPDCNPHNIAGHCGLGIEACQGWRDTGYESCYTCRRLRNGGAY